MDERFGLFTHGHVLLRCGKPVFEADFVAGQRPFSHNQNTVRPVILVPCLHDAADDNVLLRDDLLAGH